MNFLFKSIQTLSLSLNLNPNLPPPSFHHQTPLHPPKPTTTGFRQCRRSIPPTLASDHPASMSEIDMVPNKDGIFAAKPKKVVILWDLDNKPPRGPPYDAALSLINIATHFGEVVDVSAYANRHAFVHLPHWVRDQRRDQRRQDILERKGAVTPPEPYICSVCGRKCKTNLDLKKHFKQLHLREREKKMNRMKSLKGKKRQRFKERFISSDHKYMEAARTLITPRVGYGLAAELRRAGVFVKTVEDKPQAADWALKRQMQHSMSRGIDWLVLVSDDSDFVENGEITEEDLVIRRRSGEDVDDVNAGAFVSDFDERGMSLDGVLDELVRERSGFNQSKISMFSEGEEEDDDESDYLSDSDDDEEDDWYI
ncbi:putative transcription factor C2H2 family [Helianthus debilis subsp. tardiflorus]